MKEKIKGNKIYQCAFAAFIVIAASILFYFMIFRIKEILGICGWIISLFTPFIIGFVFAYLLNPVVKFFKTYIFDKVTKKSKSATNLSILLTTIVFLGIIILLFSFILPELLKSIETLAVNLPSYFESAKKYLLDALSSREELRTIVLNNYDAINEYITNFFNNKILPNVEELLVKLSDGVLGAVKVVFNILMGFVVSVYYLSDKEHFVAGIKKITYSLFSVKTANNLMDNARHTNNMFGNFLVGKLLDGFTIGFITFIFLTIFGYPYSLLIGVIIGITNMIPYFGPYIGTIPSALIILMYNPTKAFIFVLFIIALQQVDSYVIEPRLCGVKTGLKSFWVLASILFFGNVFGIVGMILGVPVFALIYGYLDNKIVNRLEEKKLPTKADDYVDLERINTKTNKKVVKN